MTGKSFFHKPKNIGLSLILVFICIGTSFADVRLPAVISDNMVLQQEMKVPLWGWAELREAQLMTLNLSNTGMAVIIDIGAANNIHPGNKQDVGKRLALWALAKDYGKDIVYSGPIYKKMVTEGNKIRLYFDHVGGGLVAKNGQLDGFAIAGSDKKFVWADAEIQGDTVLVSSREISEPAAVRYAWAIFPFCNLFNKEGLPASPFRTDSWPGITVDKK